MARGGAEATEAVPTGDAVTPQRGSFATAVLAGTVLAVVPVLGPFAGGLVAARRARGRLAGIAAAGVAAAIWAGGLYAASFGTVHTGQDVALEPLRLFVVPIAMSLVAGGLLGALGPRSLAAWIATGLAVASIVGRVQEIRPYLAVLIPASERYDAGKNRTCPENLKQLYLAVQTYAESWDGVLPPASDWLTAIRPNVPQDAWLRCPDAKGAAGETYGYAMNAALGGKRLLDVPDRAHTPLFYDSRDLPPDAHDAVTSLPRPGRHTGRNNVLYADGEVRTEAPR